MGFVLRVGLLFAIFAVNTYALQPPYEPTPSPGYSNSHRGGHGGKKHGGHGDRNGGDGRVGRHNGGHGNGREGSGGETGGAKRHGGVGRDTSNIDNYDAASGRYNDQGGHGERR